MKEQTPFIVHSHDISLDSDYIQRIADIKTRWRRTQIKGAVKVNSEQLLFNWQLGRDLVVRKAEEKWGKGCSMHRILTFMMRSVWQKII